MAFPGCDGGMLHRMRRLLSWILCPLLLLITLSACDYSLLPSMFRSKPSDPLLSKEAVATREAPAELVFQGQLAGEHVFLLVHDCEVFRVEKEEGGGVRWTSVLEPDFYPLWTSCVRQSLSFKDGALTVILGRQAFSAGGCCATGGTYRSVDGRTWRKR